ncbi:MAG: MBOAT family protein [Clostridia bacterium]|nr:MBOAT family protein [Clostridia bacterium]
MVFSSAAFLFIFLPTVFILYRIIPSHRARNALLLVFSLFFYAYGEPKAIALMLVSVVMNYLFGLGMGAENKARKPILVISVICNLALLGVFKYAGFAAETVNLIPGVNLPVPHIALPVGISFYTFQAMSYVIDAYRDPTNIQRNPFKIALYITFFPQLIAGPIVKYHDVAEQIDHREITAENTALGVKRFIVGLGEKLILANAMAVVADYVYSLDIDTVGMPLAWLGALVFPLQIYFDFGGYSNMAIGLGKMFGFEFKKNFDYPYISCSTGEFWRRWNISIGSWFGEYVYIPLGGSRKGKKREVFNKMVVFFLTGLWHGAGMTFVAWGIVNGIMICLEGLNKEYFKNLHGVRRAFGYVYTKLFLTVSTVFFRAENISFAVRFIGRMFNPATITAESLSLAAAQLSPAFVFLLIIASLNSRPTVRYVLNTVAAKSEKAAKCVNIISYVGAAGLLILCILKLASTSYNPFIYFRF